MVKHKQTNTHIFVGGMVAAGFDKSGKYLLTVSHSGRGVFAVDSWERIARDDELAYPENGTVLGIGPIQGEAIQVVEDYEGNLIKLRTPNGSQSLVYSEGIITVSDCNH